MLLSTCSGGKRSLGSFVLTITPSILWGFPAHLPPTSPHDTFSIGLLYLRYLSFAFWKPNWLLTYLSVTQIRQDGCQPSWLSLLIESGVSSAPPGPHSEDLKPLFSDKSQDDHAQGGCPPLAKLLSEHECCCQLSNCRTEPSHQYCKQEVGWRVWMSHCEHLLSRETFGSSWDPENWGSKNIC